MKFILFLTLIVIIQCYPDHYDLSQQYSYCSSFQIPFAQGRCNSCWAASAASVLSDRFCIETKGQVNAPFSVEMMVSCLPHTTYPIIWGCLPILNIIQNEQLNLFFTDHGILKDECWPYTSGVSGLDDKSHCPLLWNGTGSCIDPQVHSSLFKASNVYSVTPWVAKTQTEEKIMEHIYTKGSAWTRLKMTNRDLERFKNYVAGSIFQCEDSISDEFMHIVKLIGWGTNGGVDYWIGQNPWGADWNNNKFGYFFIARGPFGLMHYGTCSVQSAVWSADPLL